MSAVKLSRKTISLTPALTRDGREINKPAAAHRNGQQAPFGKIQRPEWPPTTTKTSERKAKSVEAPRRCSCISPIFPRSKQQSV